MFKSIITFAVSLLLSAGLFAASTPAGFLAETDALLKTYVRSGRIDYAGLKASGAIKPLITKIASTDLNTLQGNDKKAFLINAYNLLVINQALEHYPLKSVLGVSGFFDGKKQKVAGRQLTLNQLEKDLLLREFNDARLHFVLVCGALGCPPITNFAYQPTQLETQLNRQTRLALNNPNFLKVAGVKAELSKIFDWYAKDFGGSRANVIAFINQYRTEAIPADAKISYYEYDWSLNQTLGRASVEEQQEKQRIVDQMEKAAVATAANPAARGTSDLNPEGEAASQRQGGAVSTGGGNNAARYVVSSAIPQGSAEIKIFNNLYSQEAAGERSSFFTTTVSALYGATNRVNVGLELRYRRVRYDEVGDASNFDVLGSGGAFSRAAISGFGPKVRIAPFAGLPNFSIQSALWIPLANNLEGSAGGRFTDWDSPTWFTQVFNDFSIGNNFSFFAEVDFTLEDFGNKEEGSINRFSTPVTGILSYFPTPKTTLYGLASYAPFWQENFDYFYQVGAGAKYQFTPKFEIEVLVTSFDNKFLNSVNGNAGTVNLGLRFNL